MSKLTDGKKALAIIKAWHDLAHDGEWITISKNWDFNTLTIYEKNKIGSVIHNHFGQMDKDDNEGFSILIDQLFNHFVK